MKFFFLAGSIIFTVIILIVGFQNYSAQLHFTQFFFLSLDDVNPSLLFFGVALLGIFTGGFYFGFLTSLLRGDQDEEEPGGTIK